MFKYFLLSSLSSISIFGFAFQADATCVAKWINEDYYSLEPYGSLPNGVSINEVSVSSTDIKLVATSGGGYHEYVNFYLYFPFSDEDGSSHLKEDHAIKNPEELGFNIVNLLSKYLVAGYYHHSHPWNFMQISCSRSVIWVDFISATGSLKTNNLFSLFKRPSSGCFAFTAHFDIFSQWQYADVSFSALKGKSLSNLFPSSNYNRISSDYFGYFDGSLASGSETFDKNSLDFGFQLALKNISNSQLVFSSILSPDDSDYHRAYIASSWNSPQCFWYPSSVGGSFLDRILSFLGGLF